MSKYHNKKTTRMMPGGGTHTFDSQKEAERFDQLMLMQRAGEIRGLRLQAQFTLQESYITPEGDRVQAIRYVADFAYERKTKEDAYGCVYWLPVVEDVKSRATKTQAYEIKKRLLRERTGIRIIEV